jgi:glycosyltransferase involved in cell wall biosynthesis
MRILQVMAGGTKGGAERFFEDLVGAMARAGLDQYCAIRGHPERATVLAETGCPVSTLPFAGPLDPLTPWKLGRLARKWRPQVILGWMNRGCCALPKGPWVNVGRLGGYYNLKYYRRCDHLICNTPDIREYVVSEGWPTDRAHYIPNFYKATSSAPVDRATLRTPQDAKVLLILARLQTVKGIDVALRALPSIPGVILWVAGSGPLEGELQALAAECGVQDRIRFLGWRDDRSSLLNSADVCLVPSRYEPFGNVVLNAWAHGVPVVAAASQGPRFLIRGGEDGLLVPVDDPSSLAEAVMQVLERRDLADSLVKQGRLRAAGEFSEVEVLHRYGELLQNLSR